MKCDKCYSARWLYFEPSFNKQQQMSSTVRPFSRDYWSGLGKPQLAALLAAKVLMPCECNPQRHAPWADIFQAAAQPDTAAAGAPGATPF